MQFSKTKAVVFVFLFFFVWCETYLDASASDYNNVDTAGSYTLRVVPGSPACTPTIPIINGNITLQYNASLTRSEGQTSVEVKSDEIDEIEYKLSVGRVCLDPVCAICASGKPQGDPAHCVKVVNPGFPSDHHLTPNALLVYSNANAPKTPGTVKPVLVSSEPGETGAVFSIYVKTMDGYELRAGANIDVTIIGSFFEVYTRAGTTEPNGTYKMIPNQQYNMATVDMGHAAWEVPLSSLEEKRLNDAVLATYANKILGFDSAQVQAIWLATGQPVVINGQPFMISEIYRKMREAGEATPSNGNFSAVAGGRITEGGANRLSRRYLLPTFEKSKESLQHLKTTHQTPPNYSITQAGSHNCVDACRTAMTKAGLNPPDCTMPITLTYITNSGEPRWWRITISSPDRLHEQIK